MPFGKEAGLGPGDVVLDGDPALFPQRGIAPNFRSMSAVAKRMDGSRYHLVGRQISAQLHCVRWGPNFRKPLSQIRAFYTP